MPEVSRCKSYGDRQRYEGREEVNQNQIAALKAVQFHREAQEAKRAMKDLGEEMVKMAARHSNYKPTKYTGWFALFKTNHKHPAGLEFLCMFNPDESEASGEPDGWSVAIPIPDPETFREFVGW